MPKNQMWIFKANKTSSCFDMTQFNFMSKLNLINVEKEMMLSNSEFQIFVYYENNRIGFLTATSYIIISIF